MSVLSYDGWLSAESLFPFHEELNRVFNNAFGQSKGNLVGGYPKMNISVENNSFIVRAAVPGMDLKDLKVEITQDPTGKGKVGKEDYLVLSGQMKSEHKSDKETYFLRELHTSRFQRSLQLPEIITGDPEATLKDGILTLKWQTNLPVEKKPKLIEVNHSP